MCPLDEKLDSWEERLARYRKLSALLGEDEATAPLRALAVEVGRRLFKRFELKHTYEDLSCLRDVLIAEIDLVLLWTRNHLLRPPRFSPEDMREASRLCREEAQAALDTVTRRAFAARALDLAMLAEQLARQKDT